MDTKTDETEIIYVVHNAGEDKPWELKFDNVSALKRARAILNYPVHKFETEHKAVEVAEMLKSIIKADGVEVEGEIIDTEESHTEFFHAVNNEK